MQTLHLATTKQQSKTGIKNKKYGPELPGMNMKKESYWFPFEMDGYFEPAVLAQKIHYENFHDMPMHKKIVVEKLNRDGSKEQERKGSEGQEIIKACEILEYAPSTAAIHAKIHGREISIDISIGNSIFSRSNRFKEMERVRSAGGFYFVARDMQSFVDWYKENFKEGSNQHISIVKECNSLLIN